MSPPRSNVRFFSTLSQAASNSRHIRIFCDSIWISSTMPLFPNIDYSCWPNTLLPSFWYYFDFETCMVSKNMFESISCGWCMISSPGRGRLSIFLLQIVCGHWRAPSFETSNFIHLVPWLAWNSANEEIRFETLFFLSLKKLLSMLWMFFRGQAIEAEFVASSFKRSWLLFFCILNAINLMVLLLLNFQLSHRLRPNSQARLSSDGTGRSSSQGSHVWYHRVPVWSRNDNF